MMHVHVQVANEPIDFSVARPGTNVVLVAEGKEIHVNKEFLSGFSPYFSTLLMLPNKAESAPVHVNISYNHDLLLKCVEIVHGTGPLPTGEMDIEFLQSLLSAADFFDLSVVRRFCETEMASKSDDRVMLFLVACHFKLEHSKELLLARLTAKEIKTWVTEGAVSLFPSPYDLHLSAADNMKLLKVACNL